MNTRNDELLAIKHGVWITPVLDDFYFGNRESINRYTGKLYLRGHINWLLSEFDQRKIEYTVLTE